MALSNNLNQIELEIKHHKELAGKSIWEIGRRLIHVKETDLAHGQFMNWVENNLDISYYQANEFMRVAKELPNVDTWQNLGTRALYLISTLPEEEREKEHTLESGETKKVDEMVVREIEEVKRKLREKESQLERAEQSEKIAIEKLEREQNKEPEVIEKEVEPDDYDDLKNTNQQLKDELNAIEQRNQFIEKEYEKLVQQRNESEEDSEKYRQLNEEMKRMNNQLTEGQKKLKAQKEVYDLVRNANQLITEVAPLTYLIDTENILDNEYARKPIEKIVNNLRDMADRLDTSINQNIYEGEIINE